MGAEVTEVSLGGLRTFTAEEKQAVAAPKANIMVVTARQGFAT
jgi:hypothetical protein